MGGEGWENSGLNFFSAGSNAKVKGAGGWPGQRRLSHQAAAFPQQVTITARLCFCLRVVWGRKQVGTAKPPGK